MNILAIDTSCDETCAAVTRGTRVLSNVIWSQASLHAKFGGVMPSLAQRMHRERIDWVINKALTGAKAKGVRLKDLDAIAVTAGPGLAIALEVGIAKAKELASKLALPLIPVNHIEGHLLSSMAEGIKSIRAGERESISRQPEDVIFPALGLVVSGGHTELIYIEQIGKYKILAKTQDDALGEALDKAARMLGLGYPGGAILEKMARSASSGQAYPLPLPMARSAEKYSFSYSGLKTAFYRLIQEISGDPSTSSGLSAYQIYGLASGFQNRAFQHLERVISESIRAGEYKSGSDLLVGGGVAANIELRRRLRKLGKEAGLRVRFPYSNKLVGDNAAMIGIAAGFKDISNSRYMDYSRVDRIPRWSVEEV